MSWMTWTLSLGLKLIKLWIVRAGSHRCFLGPCSPQVKACRRSAPAALNIAENDGKYTCVNILSVSNGSWKFWFVFKKQTNKQNVIQETNWDQVSGIIQQPDHSTGGLTSSSFSFLKHRHAALLLKPSPSYVLVWLGLNFIIYIIKCGTGKTLRRKEAVPAESAERKSGVSRWGNEATPADWRDSHSSVHKKWNRPVRTRAVLRCGWGSAGKWSGAVFISDLRTDLSASPPPPTHLPVNLCHHQV